MNIFKRKTPKRMIEESIVFAVDSLSERIQRSGNEEKNKIDAESIKILAEAYDIVHRGKKRYDI